jgi:predicted transcriptional regulator
MRIMEHTKLLYLDQDLDARLRALATRRHERVSVIIRDLLREGLQRAEQVTPLQPTEQPRTEA